MNLKGCWITTRSTTFAHPSSRNVTGPGTLLLIVDSPCVRHRPTVSSPRLSSQPRRTVPTKMQDCFVTLPRRLVDKISSKPRTAPGNIRSYRGIPIIVYVQKRFGKRTRKIARLTVIPSEEHLNLASPDLATKLGATVHGNATIVHFQGWKLYTQGYIILDWALEPSTEPYYRTRFEVVEDDEFPYDATLGRRSALEHGFHVPVSPSRQRM